MEDNKRKGRKKDNTLNLYNTAFKALLYTLSYVGKKKKGNIDCIAKMITRLREAGVEGW